jgi:hypothetical protein
MQLEGGECITVVEYMLSMHKASGLIPSTEKERMQV